MVLVAWDDAGFGCSLFLKKGQVGSIRDGDGDSRFFMLIGNQSLVLSMDFGCEEGAIRGGKDGGE